MPALYIYNNINILYYYIYSVMGVMGVMIYKVYIVLFFLYGVFLFSILYVVNFDHYTITCITALILLYIRILQGRFYHYKLSGRGLVASILPAVVMIRALVLCPLWGLSAGRESPGRTSVSGWKRCQAVAVSFRVGCLVWPMVGAPDLPGRLLVKVGRR